MALIACVDCGREVSDAAPACPGCGRPAGAKAQRVAVDGVVATRAKTSFVTLGCGYAFAIAAAALFISLAIKACGK